MAYNITLEGKKQIEAEQLLEAVARVFESCKISYFLEGGTLLGLKRENRILPWDNDVDFTITNDALKKLPDLQSELKKNGLRLRIRYFDTDESGSFKKGNIRILKIRKYRFFKLLKGRVAADVFVKYKQADSYYWKVGEKTLKSCPVGFYQKTETINFKGFNYPAPSPIEEYLAHRYGTDWKVAKPDWNTFEDDTSIVR